MTELCRNWTSLKMAKFIHLSDTHLGYSEYTKLDPVSGINQRELDVYNAFTQAVDLIIKIKPSFILHVGDFFDTVRPPNRTINFAFNQLQRLSKESIPIIIISGNHSSPRISVSGSIFESFKVFDNVYPIYKGTYEKISLEGVAIHAIPHCSTEEDMRRNISSVKPEKGKHNILMTHAGIVHSDYQTGEFNEQKIPLEVLQNKQFDYVALGHYHLFGKVKGSFNAFYSGSTERLEFKYAGKEVGVVEADLGTFKPKLLPLQVRPMVKLDSINCDDTTPLEILKKLESFKSDISDGVLIQIQFENITKDTFLQLERKEIENIFPKAFHIEVIPKLTTDKRLVSSSTTIDELHIEFNRFLKTKKINEDDEKSLVELGGKYFAIAESEEYDSEIA